MKTNTPAARTARATTYEGTPAKQLTPLQGLRRALLSCLLWEDQFYESGETIGEMIRDLTLKVDPAEAATLAIEARNRFKLRHAPLWVARVLASGNAAQKAVVEGLLAEIIQRPDELTEFLALYWRGGKTPIAACVKRGLARAFEKFNAYALAKYDRDDAIKLRDVLFLVHAKPLDDAQAALWKQLASRTLPTPDTWEVALSAGKDKPRETWTRLLVEKKLGALALLRNLRNIQEAGVDEALLGDALNSMNVEKVLPFRFITAARYAPRLEPVLERAMYRCVEGVPKLEGRTALVVDTSPSMWQDELGRKALVSTKSDMTRFEAAAALAILCRELCDNVAVYAFNSKAYEVPARRGFALRDSLAQTKGDYSCGGLAVDLANKRGYDRIIVLTDGQWHYSSLGNGQMDKAGDANVVSPAPLTEKAYLLNIASYQLAVGSGRWEMIDGWSEAVIDYIVASESPMPSIGNA